MPLALALAVASSFGLRSGLRQSGAPLCGGLRRGAEAPLYLEATTKATTTTGILRFAQNDGFFCDRGEEKCFGNHGEERLYRRSRSATLGQALRLRPAGLRSG